MRRYILTGAPGSGKTALLRQLEIDGYGVVEEAATDVIALERAHGVDAPWEQPGFLDRVVQLQRTRQLTATAHRVTFFDRSPICTLALSRYSGTPAPAALLAEVDRSAELYEPAVFLIRNQGFIEPTAARRISFEESLRFERIHQETYREHGFTLIEVPAGPLTTRAAILRATAEPH